MTDFATDSTTNSQESETREPEHHSPVPLPLILLIFSPFILASLVRPRFLDPQSQPTKLHIDVGSAWSRVMGLIIIFVTIITTIALVSRPTLVESAKVFFIALSLLFTTIAWIVVNHQSFLMAELMLLEANVSDTRDQAISDIRSAKMLLAQLNNRVGHTSEAELASASQVLKSFGPLAMMFLKGERNVFKIGLAAAGVAGKAVALFNRSCSKSSI